MSRAQHESETPPESARAARWQDLPFGEDDPDRVFACLRATLHGAREVLVKRLRRGLRARQDLLVPFIHDARVAVTIEHDSIVTTSMFVEDKEDYFIVQDAEPGVRLSDLPSPWPLYVAVSIAVQVLGSLDCIHRRHNAQGRSLGLVHGAVWPGNVFVRRDGRVMLGDLASGRLSMRWTIDQDRRHERIAYASPEQLRGEKGVARSDVFMAAMVAWSIIHGAPLGSDDGRASSRVESYRRLPHLVSHEACPAVLRRPEILGVLRRALSEDPEGRYESAAEFEQDLRQALHERALGNVVQNVRVHLDGGALRSHA